MSPKTFPSGHSQPRRNRKDASHERRMRRGAQALLAAVAATTPGAVSAEEAAFDAFTQGAQLYQVQAVVPDANLPAVPETRSPSPGELGYVCIEAASQDGAVTAVVLAGKDRLAYRAFDTSTPYGQADVDELPCQTIAQFEEGIRDRTRRFVNATADYIEEHEAKAGLSSPNAPIMRRPEFTDNLNVALLRTAQNFNRLNSAILQRRGQEGFEALVDMDKRSALIAQYEHMTREMELLKTVNNTVPALVEQMNLGDMRPGAEGGYAPPLWNDEDSIPVSFKPDALERWRDRRPAAPVAEPPKRGMAI